MKQIRSSANNSYRKNSLSHLTTEENLVTDKTPRIHEAVSVIEDVGHSFASGVDLLEQLKQFGLETIEAHDLSICELKHKNSEKNFFEAGLEKRISEFDPILDYSRMEKLKFLELERKQSSKKSLLALMRLESIQKSLIFSQVNFKESRGDILKEINSMKNYFIDLVKHFSKNLIAKISETKKYQQVTIEELKICKEKIRVLSEENNELKMSRKEKRESNLSQKSYDKFKANPFNVFDPINEHNKNYQEFSAEYQMNSQIMRELNKEIKELNSETDKLRDENRNLKKIIEELNRKLELITEESEGKAKKFEAYHGFLDKINSLEEELTILRFHESSTRSTEKEISDQFAEIDKFLQTCEKREAELNERERSIIAREKETEFERKSTEQSNQSKAIKPDRLSFDFPSSTRFTNSSSPSRSATPRKQMNLENCNDRLFKLNLKRNPISQEIQNSSGYNRIEMIKTTSYANQSKYSDQLSGRIQRIHSSIANELNTLVIKY